MEDPTNSVFNVVTPPFSYTTAEKDNVLVLAEGESCIPGGMTIYPAVADGMYLMLAPLSQGKHTIHFVGVAGPLSSPAVKIDLTYDYHRRARIRNHSCRPGGLAATKTIPPPSADGSSAVPVIFAQNNLRSLAQNCAC